MNLLKLCKNKDCRSIGDRRVAYSLDLCQNCYMRDRRHKKRSTTNENDAAQPGPSSCQQLAGYVEHRLAALRRREVQKLLDLNLSEIEIMAAFCEQQGLRRYIEPLTQPAVAIRRDIVAIHLHDQGKTPWQLSLERTIRRLNTELQEPKLPPTAHAKLVQLLVTAEKDLAIAKGETDVGPSGRNRLLSPNGEQEGEDDDDVVYHLPNVT